MVGSYGGTGTLSWDDVQLRVPRRVTAYRPSPRAVESPAVEPARPAVEATKPSVWISLPSHSLPEHWFMCLLALAAVIGIAYGFSCLTDLVQNWAALNIGVDKLIH